MKYVVLLHTAYYNCKLCVVDYFENNLRQNAHYEMSSEWKKDTGETIQSGGKHAGPESSTKPGTQ